MHDSSADARRILEEFVGASLQEGAELGDILDGLLVAAGDMGLPSAEALDIIERAAHTVRSRETVGIQMWYDGEKAATGIAFGSTLLQFRVRNRLARPIHSVAIIIVHPLTGEVIECPAITILNKDAAKSSELTMVLDQVGRHIVGARPPSTPGQATRQAEVPVAPASNRTEVPQPEGPVVLPA